MTIKDRLDSILSQEQITDRTESSLNSATDQLLSDITEEVMTHRSTQIQSTAHTSTTTLSTTTKIITTLGTTPTTVTTQRSTTMGTTPTTTTTAPKVLDHLLATIIINRATVPDKDRFTDVSDPYVKVYVDNTYIGQTPVRKNTLTPNWNYQIAHQMTLRPDSVLQFELYDSDRYTSHEYIGKITIKTSELISDGNNGKQVYRYHGSGRLWFTVTWDEVYRNY